MSGSHVPQVNRCRSTVLSKATRAQIIPKELQMLNMELQDSASALLYFSVDVPTAGGIAS